jgi:chromosome segregation ATPase
MTNETAILQRAKRMVPLMHSITREARDRTRAIRHLEAKLKELSSRRGEQTAEIRPVESELFFHRREIERVQKELARLGCSLDVDHPERIVCSADGDEWIYEEPLDETGFRPEHSEPKS